MRLNKLICYIVLLCAAKGVLFTSVARAQNDAIDLVEEGDNEQPVNLRTLGRVKNVLLGRAANKVLETVRVRARVTEITPSSEQLWIRWREGGEALGGTPVSAMFTLPGQTFEGNAVSTPEHLPKAALKVGQWSESVALSKMLGTTPAAGYRFVTVFTQRVKEVKPRRVISEPPQQATFEFEFSTEGGEVLKTVTEKATQGATVSLAIDKTPLMEALYKQGFLGHPKDIPLRFDSKLDAGFTQQIQGLSDYVKARYERLRAKFSPDDPLPKKIGVIGNLGGFGIFGYGVRHSSPQIVDEELKTLKLLGMNGIESRPAANDLTASLNPFRLFPRITISVGAAMSGKKMRETGSPFDPALRTDMLTLVQRAIDIQKPIDVQEHWGIAGDEITVVTKTNIHKLPGVEEAFRKYLQANGVQLSELAAKSWDEVKPYPVWTPDVKVRNAPAPPPPSAADRLRYYYTWRFPTYLTGQFYTEAAEKLEAAGIKLYAMQAPAPSWGNPVFDWFEYYDQKPNRVLIFETSNRDGRMWQLDSYLSDIMRGIGERYNLPRGNLIKPHRGAAKQRMLALLARGVRGFEWYTYGPDYYKGDNWSGNPGLMDTVAEANRFAAKAEDYVYEAHWAKKPEVALVNPRSSQIWEASTGQGRSFEDTKWIYLALRHAQIPVDILSEEQLIQGKENDYKVLYVVGGNLHHKAAEKLRDWVKSGGVLWTNIDGLARDEANEPAPEMNAMLGLGKRNVETWSDYAGSGAVTITPIEEKAVPAFAPIKMADGTTSPDLRAVVAREALDVVDAAHSKVLASFADGLPAFVRHQYGQGLTYVAGTYPGAVYSRKAREDDYDMLKDYDPLLRNLIAQPALDAGVYRPVVPAVATVESLVLDKDGKRSIALINWTFKSPKSLVPLENLRIALPDAGDFKTVRSLQTGVLPVQGTGKNRSVVLPKLNEIDLLVLE